MALVKDNRRAFLKLLDAMWPGLATAFTEVMQSVRDKVVLADLEAAIARNDVAGAFAALRMDQAALFGVDEAIENVFRAGGRYQMEGVAVASTVLPVGARVTASFGGRNPRAERIARELSSRLVTEVIDDTRKTIAQAIGAGIEAGVNPRRVALDIAGRMVGGSRQGGLVGLHSVEASYVQNMRAELADPEAMANYFTRTRRDRRFDPLVRRALADGKPLSQTDIDRIAGRYADRLLALRGERIARTEALAALNAGRSEAIEQLIERGDVTRDQVTRVWDATGDGRTRDTHAAAEGQAVKQGEPFTVGGYRMLYPGDTSLGAPARETVNCRCYSSVNIDFFRGLE